MAALLTHKDAAKKLGVARHTLRRWVNAGIIPVFRDPDTGRCRYSEAALDRWLENNCETPQSKQVAS